MGRDRRRDFASRSTSRRGFLFKLGGGLALATAVGGGLTSTEAFASVTSPRISNFSASGNPLLGIEGTSDPSQPPTFTNNSANPMDVTLDSAEDIELDVGDNGAWAAPPVSFSLIVGGSEAVNVRFVGECTGAGAATIETHADLTDDQSGTVGSITLTRAFQIPESGQVQFNGTANSAGASGKYEFEIENTGCADVTFTGVGINETTTDADFVSGGGSLYSNGTEVVSDEIPIDSSDPSSDTRMDLSPTVQLNQDQILTFEFDKFQRDRGGGGGGPNVNMQGEDIRVTFYLSDGSSTTIELCLGSCDFA